MSIATVEHPPEAVQLCTKSRSARAGRSGMANHQTQGPYVLPISWEVVPFSSHNCSLRSQ